MDAGLIDGHGAVGPRRNRVDPWGDLHAVPARGMFTGNRGCLVDDRERVVRHHRGTLWISCRTDFRDRRYALARPDRWTPLFFLDDAVALAAGHRPCATCRPEDYRGFRDAVGAALDAAEPVPAAELNRRLHRERLRPGRGLDRARDRVRWRARYADLPDGTVVVDDTDGGEPHGAARLLAGEWSFRFDFAGWVEPEPRPRRGPATVLTPPTAVSALRHGFHPTLHPSALERSAPERGN